MEIGILTGNSVTTAPVYDDYTIGMRVLPLLGVIQARAEEGYAYVHQGPNGNYLSRMRDKQEQDQQACLENSQVTEENKIVSETQVSVSEGIPTEIVRSTTMTTSTIESQPVNGVKLSTEAKLSAAAVDTIQKGKSSQAPKPATEAKQPDLITLNTSDLKSTGTKVTATTATSDEQRAPQSRLDGVVPGSRVWFKAKYTPEERKAFAMERMARRFEARKKALEAEQHPKSVLSRVASVFSSWIRPESTTETNYETSTAAEAKLVQKNESKILTSISRAKPWPTNYRKNETFPSAASIASSKESAQAESVTTSNSTAADLATAKPPHATPAICTSSKSPAASELEQLTSEQLSIHLRTTPQISPIHFAISPPTSTRPLTTQPPINKSLYSATNLLLPGTSTLFPTPLSVDSYSIRSIVNTLSTTSAPRNAEALAKHYEQEIVKNRPIGVSGEEMRSLFLAWVTIERRGAEGLSEESVRRAMRMSLVKAAEILKIRRMESEKKAEEERAAREFYMAAREREKDIFLGMLGGKKVYPLTEPTAVEQSTQTETTKTEDPKTATELTHGSISIETVAATQTNPSKKRTEPISATGKASTIFSQPVSPAETTETAQTTLSTHISDPKRTMESTIRIEELSVIPAQFAQFTQGSEIKQTSEPLNVATFTQTVDSRQTTKPTRTTASMETSESTEDKLESKTSALSLFPETPDPQWTSEPTNTSTQPSEFKQIRPTRSESLANKSPSEQVAQSRPKLESTLTVEAAGASSADEFRLKNVKNEAANAVAAKAKAIIEKGKKRAERFQDMNKELKPNVVKSEVPKPEEKKSEKLESEKSECVKVEEKRTEAPITSGNVDTFKSQTVTAESSPAAAKPDSWKPEEIKMEAKTNSRNLKSSRVEGKGTVLEPAAENVGRPLIPTNAIPIHFAGAHIDSIDSSTTGVEPAVFTKPAPEHKSETLSMSPPSSVMKTQTKDTPKTLSFIERFLTITRTPSSESPVKRFIDIATETFQGNLKKLGVTIEDGAGKKAQARDKVAEVNEKSEKVGGMGGEESQISERQRKLRA